MRIFALLLLIHYQLIAQVVEPPPPQLVVDESEAPYYNDSVARHEFLSIHYTKHICQNRFGKYGLYDAYHTKLIPCAYDQLLWDQQYPERPIIAKQRDAYGAFDPVSIKNIIPFNYQNLFWEGNLLVGYPIGPIKWDRKLEVMDNSGKVLLQGIYERIRAWPDSGFWAYRFNNKGIEHYSAQGKLIDTLPNYRAYPLSDHAFKVSGYSKKLMGAGEGLVDINGNEILPPDFSHISWVTDTWAQVNGKLPDGRGLYHFQEKRIYPFTKETLRAPDALGNFVFEIGSWPDGVYYGLMDAKLQVTVKPQYKLLVHMPNSKQYCVETVTGKRGLIHADGTIAVDTVYRGFKAATISIKKSGTLIGYDTTDYYSFSDYRYDNYGLWHAGQGVVADAKYRVATPINRHFILLERNDSSALYNDTMQRITRYYRSIQTSGLDGKLVLAKPFEAADWVELDSMTGKELRQLPGFPQWLPFGIAYYQAHNGKYGLFDSILQPLTEAKYSQINELSYLPKALRPKLIQHAKVQGYGRWVAWVGKDYEATEVLILDEFGKEWLLR